MHQTLPIPDHDEPDYLLFKDLPEGNMDVDLVYTDLQHGEYVIPLADRIPTQALSDNDHTLDAYKWRNSLVPLRLRRQYGSDSRDRAYLRPGWLYIFRNGHLWRELEITRRSGFNVYHDVNLTQYKGQDQRPATAEAESHVLVPYRIGDRVDTFEIAYSEIQWSWARIDSFGGMAEGDPRMEEGPKIDPGTDDDQAGDKRGKRFRKLNLKKDNLLTKHPWLHEIPDQRGDHTGRYDIDVYSEDEVTVVFDDCMAKLRRLCREHASLVDEIDGLKPLAEVGEYALGQLVQSIIEGDAQARKDDPKAAQGDPLAEHIDRPLLDQTLKNWRTLDKGLADARREAAEAVLKHLKDEHTLVVLQDFFVDAPLNQQALGVQYWLDAVGDLAIDAAHAYVRSVHQKKVPGLEAIFDPSPGLAQIIRRLAAGKQTRQHTERDLWGLSYTDAAKTANDSTNVLDNLLTAFAAAHEDNKPEQMLQGLAVVVATYTSVDLEIQRVPLGTLIRATARRNKALYVFQTSAMRRTLEQISATEVPWLTVAGRRVERTAAELKDNPFVKRGLMGVLGVLSVVCTGLALRAVAEDPSSKNYLAFASAAGGLAAFLGERLEHVGLHGAEAASEGRASAQAAGYSHASEEISTEVFERETRAASVYAAEGGGKLLARAGRLLVRVGGPTAVAADSILSVRDICAGASLGNPGVVAGGVAELGGAVIAGYLLLYTNPITAVVGVALGLMGALAVAYFDYDDMEKALRACRFGVEPYAWGGPFDDPDVEGKRFSDPVIAPDVHVSVADFSPEMKEFFRLLFGFTLKTRVHNAVGPYPMDARPSDLGPDDVVVELHARFTRFLPLATALELQAETHLDRDLVPSGRFPSTSRQFNNADMVLLEQRDGEALPGLRAFVKLKSEEVSDSVVGRARLDVDGRHGFYVPKDKSMKEDTWNPNAWFSDDTYGRFPAQEWRRLLEVTQGQEPSPDFAIRIEGNGVSEQTLADFLTTPDERTA